MRLRRGSRSVKRRTTKQDDDADDDEAVGEVERRPVPEVEEVRHVAEADAVDEVREAAADHEAERGRQHRMPRARAAKKTSIQATATAVRTITTAVALEKSPNAIPEFCTWWIENGPTT